MSPTGVAAKTPLTIRRGEPPSVCNRAFAMPRKRRLHYVRVLAEGIGWDARTRTWEWRNPNPLPYHLATSQFEDGAIAVFSQGGKVGCVWSIASSNPERKELSSKLLLKVPRANWKETG